MNLPFSRSPRRRTHGEHSNRRAPLATRWLLMLALLASAWYAPATAQPAKSSATAPAVAPTGIPSPAEIEARIKEAEASTSLDEAAKAALVESLRRTGAYLETARDFAAKAVSFAGTLEDSPNQTAKIRQQLKADAGDDDLPEPQELAALTTEDLGQQLTKAQTEATGIESRIGEIDKAMEAGTTRPNEVRGRLAEIRKTLEELESQSNGQALPKQSAEQARGTAWLVAARHKALTEEANALEQELASQGAREELYRAQREQLAATLTGVKERQRRMQETQDQRRKAEAELARRETEATQRAAENKAPVVQQAANENSELTKSLGDLAEQLERSSEPLAQVERERKRIEEDFRGARERIGVAGVNQALGQILLDRRNALPDLRKYRKEIASRSDLIAEATLAQIRLREEQRSLRDLDAAVTELVAGTPEAQTDQIRGELRALLEKRRDLIEKALAGEEDTIRKQGELNDASEKLIQTAESYDDFLSQHLLWVRSARMVSLDTLSTLPAAMAWMFSRAGWEEVVQVLRFQYLHSPLAWLGLLVVVVLFFRQSAIKRAILAAAVPLRRVRTDRFLHTLEAIGLTWLAALPLPLACLILGRELSLSIETTAFTRNIGAALAQVSLGFYFLRAFRLTCIPGGVADRHFRWESDVLTQIRQNLRWFTPYIIVTSLVAYTIYQSHETNYGESLGRLVLIAAMIGTAVFLGRLLHPGTGVFARTLSAHPNGWANRLRRLWYPAIVGAPLALGALAVLGFVYTAGTLFESLVESAWLGLGLVLLQQLIVRWLVYTRRRLALQAALERQTAKRTLAEAASGKSEPREAEILTAQAAMEEPEVDLASLDERTRKLLNATVFMLAILGLWLIWSAMLPALAMFKQMALWHYSMVVDGASRLVPVTAADVGLVVVILFVALVAAKNLPALIEILLLQRSSINAGTRYAVRTLVSYAITAIAVVMAVGTLGLSWSQIQWLVAALSVGIGFGLQEIVANFISGIIILFERPVRVGDTVTIANTTGIVTQIKIRATTIRNWDRQELIVPNKEFITGRLLNWTLSDQLNRIVITVGIEYGSDARLALTLLTEAAAANPRVLKDPPPLASLDAFGDNALTLTLRCYLDSLDVRMGVATEMHLTIERVFREHGIGIAFPQRDINLTARDPIDVRLYRGGRDAESPLIGDAVVADTGPALIAERSPASERR